MPHLSPDQKDHIVRECGGLTGRERTRMVRELSVKYNCHTSTIYRALPRASGPRRADHGTERCDVSEEAYMKMLALSTTRDLSGDEVIELAENSGWIKRGSVSVPTWNRWLKRRQLSKRQRERFIKPYVRFEESFSNERHYIDITGFPDYFVEPDGSIGFESTLSVSKNRAGNRKPRLQLFWLTDGHSRTQFARFFQGKNTLNWVEFLVEAWGVKEDPYTFPFQGRPRQLYSDMESIFFTPLMKRFLSAMDVRYQHHVPGNSRAKGKVERPIGVAQNWLRHSFGLIKKPTLTQANAHLQDLLYKINGRVHRTTHQRPLERWQGGFPSDHAIRLMPDERVSARFFYTSVNRVIQGDLTVQLSGLKWQLPRKAPFTNWSGQSVPVFYHPGEGLRSIFVVLDEVEYEVEHSTPVPEVAGTFRKIPATDQEKLLEELEEVDLSDAQVGGHKERYARRTFLPAPGEELDVESLQLPRRALPRIQLIQRLQALGLVCVPPSPSEKECLDALYAEDAQVFEEDLDRIIEELSGGSSQFRVQAAS